MSTPLEGHTKRIEDNNITVYVQWIDSILTDDILSNSHLLRIENHKWKKRRRQERQKDGEVGIELGENHKRSAKQFRRQDGQNISKTSKEEKGIHYERENKEVVKTSLYRNIKWHIPLNTLDLDENGSFLHKYSEVDPTNKDKLHHGGEVKNDYSSSSDIEEIGSDEDFVEDVAKLNSREVQERNLYKRKKNYQEMYNKYDHEHFDAEHDDPNPFAYDITSSLLFYSSDDDYSDGDGEKNAKSRNSKGVHFSPFPLKYNKLEKNINNMQELDEQFYNISRQGNNQEKSINECDMNQTKTHATTANVYGKNKNTNIDHEGNRSRTSSINNAISPTISPSELANVTNKEKMNDYYDKDKQNINNINNSKNNGVDVNTDEKMKKQEILSPKNKAHIFSFWNVEHETYVTRPLYAQHLNKKEITLLDESEEMVKNYSQNKYSIKFVPRHLLYVMSQVASRTFFDPLYRKQLFRHF
ncbi:hypothetical protein, conserved [Plasmodium gonderi]|uniref:Uncharacterized protein n=1 Tax=Plasmodium gonderi TaxID=77519 RepID=A0A1Y1JEE0_PLAGO|nr:hypothetical protein, conserved [Plasmodium gonderi]GAW79577.1 hypothetical protein, conserved [Plasmodium gonderi]